MEAKEGIIRIDFNSILELACDTRVPGNYMHGGYDGDDEDRPEL